MRKVAFITGITGQDGSYLAEFLLSKGYEVHGTLRRNSTFTTGRIDNIMRNDNLYLHHGDLSDSSNLFGLLRSISPGEIYNLGAQSHVAVSFEVPEYTADVDAIGTIRLLSAMRDLGLDSRFYQASTSELFGGLPETAPQSEKTPFYPKSPYGVAKLYSYWVTVNYREAYDLFCCNGILFNHESPRRGETFVTKKITKGVASIVKGKADTLSLGNLDAKRDWGYAKEYVECMWQMLQLEHPHDFVVASGECYTVRQFVEFAFEAVDININWEGSGVEEVGKDSKTGKVLVKIDPKYFRPTEVEVLLGDPTKARSLLGWKAKTSAKELAKIMVNYDLMYDSYGYDDPIFEKD